mgnify:FL=1
MDLLNFGRIHKLTMKTLFFIKSSFGRSLAWGLVLIVSMARQGQASHILSGYLGVVQTSSDSVRLQMSLYLDTMGLISPQLTVERWDLVGGNGQLNGSVDLIQQSVTTFQGVRIVAYLSPSIYLASGQYRFVYKHCCRNPLVMNMPTLAPAFPFVIGTDYNKVPFMPPTTPSNTPLFTSPVPFNLLEDTAQLLAFGSYLTEPDGDSLVVEADSILIDHGTSGFVAASMATALSAWGPYLVGPSTLNVLWRPDSSGLYAAGWRIKEFRNGQVIGIQRVQHHFRVVKSFATSLIDLGRDEISTWDPESQGDYYNLNGQLIFSGVWGKDRRYDGVLLIRQGSRFWKKAWLP